MSISLQTRLNAFEDIYNSVSTSDYKESYSLRNTSSSLKVLQISIEKYKERVKSTLETMKILENDFSVVFIKDSKVEYL